MIAALRPVAAGLLALLLAQLAPVAAAQTIEGATLGAPLPEPFPEADQDAEMGAFRFTHYTVSRDLVLSLWRTGRGESPVLSIQIARRAPHIRAESPVDGFTFGTTSTRMIEARFGPPGPVYEIIGARGEFGDITTHTLSYEIDDGLRVITFVTLEDANQPDTVGRGQARLDAIILSDRAVQETLWGRPSYPNAAYAPIPDPLPETWFSE